jgi:uncharacterized membrane protein YhhN
VILIPAIVVSAFAAALLHDRHPGFARFFKMAAATAVLVLVFALSPQASVYLFLIVVALAASWIGDLALTLTSKFAFVIGLVAFAGAHIAYVAAFVSRSPLDPKALTISAAMMTAFAIIVLRWLAPHAPEELRIPITVYVVIISVMVAVAFATHATTPDIRIPIGAVAFAASDLFVARQRFVRKSRMNRIVGLPLYFVAQILFATTP